MILSTSPIYFVDLQSDFLCPRSLKSVGRRLESGMQILAMKDSNRKTSINVGRYKRKASNLDPYLKGLQKEKFQIRNEDTKT